MEEGRTNVDPLTYIFLRKRNLAEASDEEILSQDIDQYFWETLKSKVKNNNLISISVRGLATSGKTTVALKIKAIVNKYIEEFDKNKNIDEYETICSDQIEWNRFINSEKTNVCALIDEWSALGDSGVNASTEQNVFRFYADVCAQLYIHRIFCKVRGYGLYDEVSDLLLDIVGRNEQEKTTLCRVYYNDSATRISIPLGVINVYIGDILEKDWYRRYKKKKFARMDLLKKYGVPDIRTLELSKITMMGYNELLPIVEDNLIKMPSELVSLTTLNILQREKLFYSILGATELDYRIKALLGLRVGINKEKMKLEIPKYDFQAEKIRKSVEIMEKKLGELIGREERNVQILNEYRNIK